MAPKWKWRDSANETASHYAWLPPEGRIIADLMRGDIVHRHFCSWAMRPPALLRRYKPPQQASGLLKWLTGWATGSAPAKCSLLQLRRRGESGSGSDSYTVYPARSEDAGVKNRNRAPQPGDTTASEHYSNSYVVPRVLCYVLWIITWDGSGTCTVHIVHYHHHWCSELLCMGHCGWIGQ